MCPTESATVPCCANFKLTRVTADPISCPIIIPGNIACNIVFRVITPSYCKRPYRDFKGMLESWKMQPPMQFFRFGYHRMSFLLLLLSAIAGSTDVKGLGGAGAGGWTSVRIPTTVLDGAPQLGCSLPILSMPRGGSAPEGTLVAQDKSKGVTWLVSLSSSSKRRIRALAVELPYSAGNHETAVSPDSE